MSFSRLTFEDRKKIQELLESGAELKVIGKKIDKSDPCIYSEVKKNGGMRIYNAEISQKRYDDLMKKAHSGKNTPLMHLTKRVNELEILVKQLIEDKNGK